MSLIRLMPLHSEPLSFKKMSKVNGFFNRHNTCPQCTQHNICCTIFHLYPKMCLNDHRWVLVTCENIHKCLLIQLHCYIICSRFRCGKFFFLVCFSLISKLVQKDEDFLVIPVIKKFFTKGMEEKKRGIKMHQSWHYFFP